MTKRTINEMASRLTPDEALARQIKAQLDPAADPMGVGMSDEELVAFKRNLYDRMKKGVVKFSFEKVASWRERVMWQLGWALDPARGKDRFRKVPEGETMPPEPAADVRVAYGTLIPPICDGYVELKGSAYDIESQEKRRAAAGPGDRWEDLHSLFSFFDVNRTSLQGAGALSNDDILGAWRAFYPDLIINVAPESEDIPGEEMFPDLYAMQSRDESSPVSESLDLSDFFVDL